jgi:outer membrane lipoprotein SlyB
MKKSIKIIALIGALALTGCATQAQFLIRNQAMANQTVDSDQSRSRA